VQGANQLLHQFKQTQKMMEMVAKGGMQKMLRGMKGMHARHALTAGDARGCPRGGPSR